MSPMHTRCTHARTHASTHARTDVHTKRAHARKVYMLDLTALVLLMQYLTLEKDVRLHTVASLLKALSPVGYRNPRLKRLEKYSSVIQADAEILSALSELPMRDSASSALSKVAAKLEPADLQQQEAGPNPLCGDASQNLQVTEASALPAPRIYAMVRPAAQDVTDPCDELRHISAPFVCPPKAQSGATANTVLEAPEIVSTANLERMVTDDMEDTEQAIKTTRATRAMATGKEKGAQALEVMDECAQLRQKLSKALADKDEALAREKALIEQLRWLSPKLSPTERPTQAEYRAQAEAFLQRRGSASSDAQQFRPSLID